MSDEIIFEPWGVQKKILKENKRIIGAFAGKRGGKTEIGAIKVIKLTEEKPGWKPNGIDPFLTAIIAPTNDMLRRLSWKKFYAYAKHFFPQGYNKTTHEGTWHDGSNVYGLSADNPTRIEGIKANVIWLDEVFQMSEQTFLECRARISDSEGYLICTGSLGIQIINPKQHWAHHYFKLNPDENTVCYEWSTKDNPHFPAEEIESLKRTLDPLTFRSMFEIDWDTIPKNGVYLDFSDNHVVDINYNPNLTTYVSIDWGWAHPMAVGFFQHDTVNDTVYLIDEIIGSRLTLEELYRQIMAKGYQITDWDCDIAGSQEREQTGKSNIKWFNDRGIHFKTRTSAVTYGISIVRSYIKNTKGQIKFYVSSRCKKSIDGLRQYRYPEKDGIIQNENPIKKDDDACDMIRYFFVNFFDRTISQPRNTIGRLR